MNSQMIPSLSKVIKQNIKQVFEQSKQINQGVHTRTNPANKIKQSNNKLTQTVNNEVPYPIIYKRVKEPPIN